MTEPNRDNPADPAAPEDHTPDHQAEDQEVGDEHVDEEEFEDEPMTLPEGPVNIVAKGAAYYRNIRFVLVVATIGFGLWFLYDGFIGWPEDNREIDRIEALQADAAAELDDLQDDDDASEDDLEAAEQRVNELAAERADLPGDKHDDWDLGGQIALGIVLPILGVALLFWTLHKSKGRFHMTGSVAEGFTLETPDRQKLTVDENCEVDDTLWDRKGVAELHTPDGSVVLDDFIYSRKPVDEIHDIAVLLQQGNEAGEAVEDETTEEDSTDEQAAADGPRA